MSKYQSTIMRDAINWANESQCVRKKVAAILVRNDRIRAISYNGTVSGSDNCCEKEYYVCSYCKQEFETEVDADIHVVNKCGILAQSKNKDIVVNITKELHGDDDAIVHAEVNLIADCAANGIKTKKADVYVTTAPCINCANLLIQAKIKRVYYLEEFNNDKGIIKLRNSKVKVIKIDKQECV